MANLKTSCGCGTEKSECCSRCNQTPIPDIDPDKAYNVVLTEVFETSGVTGCTTSVSCREVILRFSNFIQRVATEVVAFLNPIDCFEGMIRSVNPDLSNRDIAGSIDHFRGTGLQIDEAITPSTPLGPLNDTITTVVVDFTSCPQLARMDFYHSIQGRHDIQGYLELDVERSLDGGASWTGFNVGGLDQSGFTDSNANPFNGFHEELSFPEIGTVGMKLAGTQTIMLRLNLVKNELSTSGAAGDTGTVYLNQRNIIVQPIVFDCCES